MNAPIGEQDRDEVVTLVANVLVARGWDRDEATGTWGKDGKRTRMSSALARCFSELEQGRRERQENLRRLRAAARLRDFSAADHALEAFDDDVADMKLKRQVRALELLRDGVDERLTAAHDEVASRRYWKRFERKGR